MPKTKPTLPLRHDDGSLVRPLSLRRCRFPRTVFHVSWDAGLRTWLVRCGRHVISVYALRNEAIKTCRDHLRRLWVTHGIPGQLWVQNRKTGQFSKAEATYGLDPRGSKG